MSHLKEKRNASEFEGSGFERPAWFSAPPLGRVIEAGCLEFVHTDWRAVPVEFEAGVMSNLLLEYGWMAPGEDLPSAEFSSGITRPAPPPVGW